MEDNLNEPRLAHCGYSVLVSLDPFPHTRNPQELTTLKTSLQIFGKYLQMNVKLLIRVENISAKGEISHCFNSSQLLKTCGQ